MNNTLFKQNKKIKQEADTLLHEKQLLHILCAFGKPYVSGSYTLDLMTWRDLDLYVVADLSQRQFFQLGGDLCATLSPYRMHFRSEQLAGTIGMPNGLYWGIYLGDERQGAWKIDVWVVTTAEHTRLNNYSDVLKAQLNAARSQSILSIKSQCWQDPEYRRLYHSSDIYNAVLQHGVVDLEGFWNYLDQK